MVAWMKEIKQNERRSIPKLNNSENKISTGEEPIPLKKIISKLMWAHFPFIDPFLSLTEQFLRNELTKKV